MEPIGRQAKGEMHFARNAFDHLANAMHPASPPRRWLCAHGVGSARSRRSCGAIAVAMARWQNRDRPHDPLFLLTGLEYGVQLIQYIPPIASSEMILCRTLSWCLPLCHEERKPHHIPVAFNPGAGQTNARSLFQKTQAQTFERFPKPAVGSIWMIQREEPERCSGSSLCSGSTILDGPGTIFKELVPMPPSLWQVERIKLPIIARGDIHDPIRYCRGRIINVSLHGIAPKNSPGPGIEGEKFHII